MKCYRPCRYGRNPETNRCNKPCQIRRQKVAPGKTGKCHRKVKTKSNCRPGRELVRFSTHIECLPECEYRNRMTKRCEERPLVDDEGSSLDFIDDHGSLREIQTGQKLK